MTESTDTPAPVENTTEGRIIHVRMPGISHCIPAIVVRTWGQAANVLLFPDGSNDSYAPIGHDPAHGAVYALPWMTSVQHESATNSDNASWHWPERV
jgi:hypothetical protein